MRDPVAHRESPVLDADNTSFWTSGADGVLRMLRCDGCHTWVHPPAPCCPTCLGVDVRPDELSGRGEVHCVTVNEHGWTPGATPYVIAVVELAEQPGLRLTTNVLVDDLDSVTVGQAVEVRFVAAGEVWVPVFVPAVP
jgi:uncharacterized OB-fold protein